MLVVVRSHKPRTTECRRLFKTQPLNATCARPAPNIAPATRGAADDGLTVPYVPFCMHACIFRVLTLFALAGRKMQSLHPINSATCSFGTIDCYKWDLLSSGSSVI